MFSRLAGKTRRIGILVMVVMLAVQPMAGAAVAAGSSGPDCSPTGPDRGYGDLFVDHFIPDETVDLGSKLLGNGETTDCYTGEQVSNLTRTSVFASGAAVHDQANLTEVLMDNGIEEMRPHVRSKVKATIVREWENGSNASQIKTAVNATVDNHYASVQLNAVRSWESVAYHTYALGNQSYNAGIQQFWWVKEADISGGNPGLPISSSNINGVINDQQYNLQIDTRTENVTLVNGTTVQYKGLEKRDGSNSYQYFDPYGDESNANYVTGTPNGPENSNGTIYILKTDGTTATTYDHSNAQTLDLTNYHKVNDSINIEAARIKDNAAVLVDNLTAQYNYSELNITSILSASDLAANWSTNLNSTGYYSWSAAELSTLGINGSTSQSFYIEYEPEYDNTTGTFEPNTSTYNGSALNMSGTMFTNWRPSKTNGTFQTGTTYQIPDDEVVIFVWQKTSNKTVRHRLDGNITVKSLTDVQTGTELNNTTLQEDYRAQFTTEFNDSWLENVLAYQQNVHDDAEGSSGGGGGFDWGSFDVGMASIGFLAVIGGAFVLILGRN